MIPAIMFLTSCSFQIFSWSQLGTENVIKLSIKPDYIHFPYRLRRELETTDKKYFEVATSISDQGNHRPIESRSRNREKSDLRSCIKVDRVQYPRKVPGSGSMVSGLHFVRPPNGALYENKLATGNRRIYLGSLIEVDCPPPDSRT
jgi:hypothetical protein